ncbi:MAG: hypothetical protein K0Q53_2279 [Massilibacillus sp.]|jgi:hypothetical protein|nr:hypothetical protein [Massilibacillus sp.]
MAGFGEEEIITLTKGFINKHAQNIECKLRTNTTDQNKVAGDLVVNLINNVLPMIVANVISENNKQIEKEFNQLREAITTLSQQKQ